LRFRADASESPSAARALDERRALWPYAVGRLVSTRGGTRRWPLRRRPPLDQAAAVPWNGSSRSAGGGEELHSTAQAAKPGDIAIAAQQRVDLGVQLSGCHDQGIGHPKRLGPGAQLGGAVGYLDVDRDDSGDDVGEEARDILNGVMSDPRPGENLGIGDDRDEDSLPAGDLPDRRVGGLVQRVSASSRKPTNPGAHTIHDRA
jgi:hypothetical protein